MPVTAFPGATAPNRQNPASQGGGKTINVASGNGPEDVGAVGAMVPFSRAAKLRTDSSKQLTGTIAAATSNVSFTPIPTTGYLYAMYLVVTVTTAGNSANTAFNADAPWNFIRQLAFKTPDGTPIINNLTGYQMYLAAKWGGYRLGRPEGSSLAYSVTTGTGATGGSFQFVLPIYLGFGRDGLGLLANMDASAAYQLDLVLGTSTDLYSTAPTAAGTYTISLYLESYSNPPDTIDGVPARTEPPALGSTQFWSVQNYSWSGTGEQTVLLTRTGNLLRDLLFVWRNTSQARAAAVMPTANIRVELDQMSLQTESILLNQFRTYRYATFDLDTGLSIITYTTDPDDILTGEFGDRWLPTFTQTRYAITFTPAAAGSLEILVNDIVPVGDIYRI